MPKLLDFLKEKEISHADAMELIEKNYVKPDDEEEVEDESDEEEDENDKPEDELEDEIDELEVDDKIKAEVQRLADEEEAKAKADKAKIALMVQEELKKRGKVKRKAPSKGSITDTPKLDYDINVKGYEVKTTRKKKKESNK